MNFQREGLILLKLLSWHAEPCSLKKTAQKAFAVGKNEVSGPREALKIDLPRDLSNIFKRNIYGKMHPEF